MIFFTMADDSQHTRIPPERVERMYRQYADMIYRIAFVRTRNAADAEDVLQEVFCRYIRSAPEFISEGYCRAWFIRTAINCSKSLLTSAWRRHALLGQEAEEGATDTMERTSEVYDAVLSLPASQRTVVHLYYYEDCTVGQIAQLTGLGVSAVKSRLLRARRELRRQLKEDIDV